MPYLFPCDPGSKLEGAAILREIPDDLGVVLWRAFRDAVLWLRSAPGERPRIFARNASLGDDHQLQGGLAGALAEFDLLLSAPAEAEPVRLSRASRRIATWAHERGHRGTAMHFALLAAMLSPLSGEAALRAGRMTRDAGCFVEAEPWVRTAIALGRSATDVRLTCEALNLLGNIRWRRGDLPDADRAFARAGRLARSADLREPQAEALHNLFCLSLERAVAGVATAPLQTPVLLSESAYREVEVRARIAFEVMGPRYKRMAAFAQDAAMAFLWRGRYASAVAIFRALLPHFSCPQDQVCVWGNLAQASGAMGDGETFGVAARAVWDIVEEHTFGAYHASSLLSVAEGAYRMGRLSEATAAAKAAFDLAHARREGRVEIEAEAMRLAIQQALIASTETAERHEAARPEEPDPFALELVRALR
jgi:tetratricopeptide (TPR) repeat protein